ncbi:MAG: hypothetical protein QOF91_508 [Alphaproteobacteria bacterium]|jgi:hypothetical protein|nr:hypothetical protein [Alphaproteobacteria bacterium]
MTAADEYRAKAIELVAKASRESNPGLFSECVRLAHGYLLLAAQADRNSLTDLVYETPRRPEPARPVQQQQQQQPQSGPGEEP